MQVQRFVIKPVGICALFMHSYKTDFKNDWPSSGLKVVTASS